MSPRKRDLRRMETFRRGAAKATREAWATVRIWSGQWGAWWCPEGEGYTDQPDRAGVYTLSDACAWTFHCGPEKQIRFERVSA